MKATTGDSGLTGRFKKVKPKSLQVFSRQLATMIEAGVSIVAALVTLEQQTDSYRDLSSSLGYDV